MGESEWVSKREREREREKKKAWWGNANLPLRAFLPFDDTLDREKERWVRRNNNKNKTTIDGQTHIYDYNAASEVSAQQQTGQDQRSWTITLPWIGHMIDYHRNDKAPIKKVILE